MLNSILNTIHTLQIDKMLKFNNIILAKMWRNDNSHTSCWERKLTLIVLEKFDIILIKT